jgi:hypothetical protein
MVLAVAFSVVSVFAQKHMQPRKGDTKIYANEVRAAYETPVATVGPNEVLTVEAATKNHYKVRTASGEVGYVAKNDLTKMSAAKSRTITFEGADVVGYNDTRMPVFILDGDGPDADPISLDRSFKEALRENIDKETLSRLAL